MGEVRVKLGRPQPSEFAPDDIVIDQSTGDIYFKDRDGDLRFIENTPASGVPTGVKILEGPIWVSGSISGNDSASFTYISASGTIHADNFSSHGGDARGIKFLDDFYLSGSLDVEKNISASGKIIAGTISASSSTGSFTGSFLGTMVSADLTGLLVESASIKLQTASLLAFTSSVNSQTASLLLHTASLNTFTASGFQSPLSMSVGTTLSNTTNIAGNPLYVHGNISASGKIIGTINGGSF